MALDNAPAEWWIGAGRLVFAFLPLQDAHDDGAGAHSVVGDDVLDVRCVLPTVYTYCRGEHLSVAKQPTGNALCMVCAVLVYLLCNGVGWASAGGVNVSNPPPHCGFLQMRGSGGRWM